MKIEKKHHYATFAALIALTFLTLALSYVELGDVGPVIALLIAAAKGSLVAGFFMHLVEDRSSNSLAFGIAVGMFCLLVLFTTLDVRTREEAHVVPPDVRPLAPDEHRQ